MKITKIAFTTDQNRTKISATESDIKSIKQDLKILKRDQKKAVSDISAIKNTLKNLNIGNRLFFQHKTVFNTLQRKIEKFEQVEKEWKKYRETLDKKMKSLVMKKNRASVRI